MQRYLPVTARGSVVGLVASYWFAVVAIVIVIAMVARSNPIAAFVILLLGAALAGISAFFAAGAEITADENYVTVKRRMRATWRIPADELRVVEEHIPLRPRTRSLAGWVFRGQGDEKATIEMAMFSPFDRRKLRKAFGNVLVSPDQGPPRR